MAENKKLNGLLDIPEGEESEEPDDILKNTKKDSLE